MVWIQATPACSCSPRLVPQPEHAAVYQRVRGQDLHGELCDLCTLAVRSTQGEVVWDEASGPKGTLEVWTSTILSSSLCLLVPGGGWVREVSDPRAGPGEPLPAFPATDPSDPCPGPPTCSRPFSPTQLDATLAAESWARLCQCGSGP